MTREELRDTMLVSGELARLKETPNWKTAFELYKQATGDREVSLNCSTCFRKVRTWLER